MTKQKNRQNCLYELTAHKSNGSNVEKLFFVNLKSIERFENLLRKNENFIGYTYLSSSSTTILNSYTKNF